MSFGSSASCTTCSSALRRSSSCFSVLQWSASAENAACDAATAAHAAVPFVCLSSSAKSIG